MKFISKICDYIKENKMISFLSDKKFQNPKSKIFLYHGTKVKPENFILKDDYDSEDSNDWSGDLPSGYLFLTTDIKEAAAYGQYIIICELKEYDHLGFKVNSDSPSVVFDKDYGIDLYMPDKYFGFWEQFEESGKTSLIIKGYNNRWTIITPFNNVIPRIDLTKEYYNKK